MLGYTKDAARKIAYSSEFVDDAVIRKVIFKHTPRGVKCHIFGKRPGLDNAATCPRIMTVWNYKARMMMEVLVPFHFVPAGRGRTFQEKMRTFPDSPILEGLTDEAVNSGNIYRLGILLHAVADACSHRGFSGIISRRNRIRNLRVDKRSVKGFHQRLVRTYMTRFDRIMTRIFGRMLPVYSHSSAGTIPDIASAEWEYEYDTGGSFIARYRHSGHISNPHRYREAFEGIHKILTEFGNKNPGIREEPPQKTDMQIFHAQFAKPLSLRDSVENWKGFLLQHGLLEEDDPALRYDPHEWVREAFSDYRKKKYSRPVVPNAEAAAGFIRSDWYAFYSAAAEYREQHARLAVHYGIL
jgi:hypothetical protein